MDPAVKSHFLHGDSETGLEGGRVRGRHGTSDSQGNLGSNVTHQARRNDSVASHLGLDGSNRGLVGATNGRNVTGFASSVDSLGRKREIVVDLVEHANVDLGQLGSGSDTGKERSMRVASANVETRKSGLSSKGVGSISTNLDSLGESKTSRSANLGHVNDIKDTSGNKVSLRVLSTQVGTLARLEGKLDVRSDSEGSLQDASTVSLDLSLVNIEFGIRKLGTNLGRESTSSALLSLNGHSDGTGRLLALERYLVGVVISQKT